MPADAKGAVLAEVSGYASVSVEVFEEGSWPGFFDSVLNGAGALRAIVSVGLIVFGVLVPFLPIIDGVTALIWWRRRRRRGIDTPPAKPWETADVVPEEQPEDERNDGIPVVDGGNLADLVVR